MENFRDYGIELSGSATEQKLHCPQCPTRKPYKNAGSSRDKDLAVNTAKGTWVCFRCGWTGGLKRENDHKVVFRPAVKRSVPSPDDRTKNMYLWFEKKRQIPRSVIDRNNITLENTYVPTKKENENCVTFNYFIDDVIVNCKYRTNDKKFHQIKDGIEVFYKLNDIIGEKTCIITEGEIDALSFEVAGYKNAVSVPNGGINPETKNITKKLEFVDNCAYYFKDMQKIYLASDTDGPGVRLKEELARRLGKNRCWIVKYPAGCKDANDVLVKFGKNELITCIHTAEPYPVSGILYANDRLDEVLDIYENGYPGGAKTGWYKFDELVRIYDSILAVFTGIPSHGKSNFVDHLMIRLSIKHGWKWGVFSPENGKLEIHLNRLIEIVVGNAMLPGYNNRMTVDELQEAMKWVNEHFFFINPQQENKEKDEDFGTEDYSLDNILTAARWLVLKYGIKGIITDPWNAIEHDFGSDNETEYTKKTLNKLTYFERSHGLFFGIVAHPTKMKKKPGSNFYEVVTAYDINGSAHWYNKAEMIFSVYRKFSSDFSSTESTDVYIQKVKHKFMGKPGKVQFDFQLKSQRFVEKGSTDDGNYLHGYNSMLKDENANYDSRLDFNKTDDDVPF